jgi:alpha-beta hydrolase superfamily lysophospholipase
MKKRIEEGIFFKTPDGKKIYGTLGYPEKTTDSVVLFVHGLASTEYWPPMLLGSWYMRSKGFAYCRINLYWYENDARTLMTSSLQDHASDVDIVVKVLKRKGFKKVYAVGHSFGGLTLLLSSTDAYSAISLWDCSSLISYNPLQQLKPIKGSSLMFMNGFFELVMSKKYMNGIKKFPNELDLAAKINCPVQVCYAAGKKAVLIESSKRYYDTITAKKELVAIEGASHSFTEEGTSEELFKKVYKWFKNKTRIL